MSYLIAYYLPFLIIGVAAVVLPLGSLYLDKRAAREWERTGRRAYVRRERVTERARHS